MGTNHFIPALWRPRQVALWEFKASLTYIVYCSPAWTTWSVPVPPKQYEQIHFHVKKQLHSSVFRGGHVKGKQGLGSLGGAIRLESEGPCIHQQYRRKPNKNYSPKSHPPQCHLPAPYWTFVLTVTTCSQAIGRKVSCEHLRSVGCCGHGRERHTVPPVPVSSEVSSP